MSLVGQKLPAGTFHENNPGTSVNVHELFAGKKGILIGVPGAFTPTCSNSHLPGFISNIEEVRSKGYSVVACMTVNDSFVTAAWGKSLGADDKVRILADPAGAYAKALNMDKDIAPLGGVRSKRFTMLIEDNVVKAVFEEPDGTGATCSLAPNVLKHL